MQFFSWVIKFQNLNEVLLKGFQLGCKINDLCSNLHPSLVVSWQKLEDRNAVGSVSLYLHPMSPQSQIDCSLMTGGGSIQCPYNNGRLSLPFTPICNHREKVITLINITYAHFNGVAFTTSYFKDKAHKSSSSYFLIVYFFLFYSFFSSCFSFLRKKRWLWWWCSKLVIEMQLLNLETHYTCNNGR